MFLSTHFTKSSVGIVTITDLTLLNLENYVKNLDLLHNSLYVKFKLNNNKNYALNAHQVRDQPLSKENMCLFN